MDVDDALAYVGGYKRWHLTMFVLLGVSMFTCLCLQGLSFVFTGWQPPHHCRVPENRTFNETIPWVRQKDGTMGWSQCTMYANQTSRNATVACTHGWTNGSPRDKTIVTEWSLLCDRDYMSEMTQICYQAGALLGEIVCPQFIDRFGRKKVHISFTLIVGVLGTALAFAPNLIAFIVLRTLIGILIAGCIGSGVAMMMEIFDSRHRTFAGVGLEFLWVFDYMLLAMMAYFIRDWRHLQLGISLICFIWIIYIWILPESPIWLLANGKEDEAEEVLKHMAKCNRVRAPKRLLKKKKDSKQLMKGEGKEEGEEEGPKYNVTHLFRDRKLLRHTAIMSAVWFANHNVYYGLTLCTPSLGGNRYLNFVLMGLVELPCYVILFFIIEKYGRRIPLIAFHILAGIPLAAAMFVPNYSASGVYLRPLQTTLALMGKFGITGSFCIIVMFTPELFPTNLRGTGYGFVNILGRVGNMCTPLAAYAAKQVPWLPNIIFGCISIAAGFLAMLLPETLNRPLPQTIEDIHKWYKKGAYRKGSHIPIKNPKPKFSIVSVEMDDKESHT